MKPHSDEIFTWYEDLSEVKPEFTPIKVVNLLQFYTLRGKTTILKSENLVAIPDLTYIVNGKNGKYYVKPFRNYDVDTLYFYRKSLTFSGEDDAVEILQRYVYDDNVWLLFTPEMVEDTKQMLARVYKAHSSGNGTLSYHIYISLLDWSVKLEDYKDYGKELIGFKTMCKTMEDRIQSLWKEAFESNK